MVVSGEADQPPATGVDGDVGRFERAPRHRADAPPTLETDARIGLDNDEFHLLYQVRVDPRTEDVHGAEALLRWRDQYRGTMTPGLFLPALADTAVMGQLGRWVLAQACLQATRWEARRPPSRPRIVVSVNATATQAVHRGFIDFVAAALEVSGIDPSLLQLEVGLRADDTDDPVLHDRLESLRALGVGVALDGVEPSFGRDGFLPCGGVNLARRALRNLTPGSKAADAIAGLVERAHAADRWVCAVGVETREQADVLAAVGCDLAQGFLYSEPVAASELGWQAPAVAAVATPQEARPSSSKTSMTGSGPLPKRQRRAG
jgi:EAL domain-containing protein (putative c-di-GMP-specific phosphodiesterase class I)